MEEVTVHANKELNYPQQAVMQEFQAWWDDETGAGVAKDPFADPTVRGGSVFDLQPAIDSLRIVTALVSIEKHLGFNVPVNVIQRGGYNSFEEMVTDLVPKVQALYEQRKAVTE
jgi:acyl carrier protein